MKKLLVVESSAKIKTISKFIGKDFLIVATVGHIKDLSQKNLGFKINKKNELELNYVTIKDKDKVLKNIISTAKQASEIYLAPDPDREGEIIAFHVQQELEKNFDKDKIFRISFNEITKDAINNSLKNPGKLNYKKIAAQQSRRIVDRIVGFEVSPILWKKISTGLSAGRVQSIALKLICLRESEIKDFKKEEYWSITGEFIASKYKISAELSKINNKNFKLNSKSETDKVLSELTNETFSVKEINDKKRLQNPIAPFTTSTLQQAAINKLGFSLKKTMSCAQTLYEGTNIGESKDQTALITYIRTDSTRLSETATTQASELILKTYGDNYLPKTLNNYSKKKNSTTQDAHEAIRPINLNLRPEDLIDKIPTELYKLYDLIWKRTVASQMKSATYAQREVIIASKKFSFKSIGSTLIFDGFLKIYNDEEEEKDKKEAIVKIPNSISSADLLKLNKINPTQHFTNPPARYTEASLVKELEKKGIGRPSTYLPTLSTLQNRKYAELIKKKFFPTDLGTKVFEILNNNLKKIMELKFTAEMESDLDKIEAGELTRENLINSFYESFKKELESFKDSKNELSRKTLEITSLSCPNCTEKLALRISKKGSFLGCSKFPDCKFTSKFERTESGEIKMLKTEDKKILLEENCTKCNSSMVEIQGKYGKFIACSAYPNCKFIKQNKANFNCPDCNGAIIEKKWRRGSIWGCEKYPNCKFSIFSDIEQTNCSKCHLSKYLIKKTNKDQSIKLICPNNDCK